MSRFKWLDAGFLGIVVVTLVALYVGGIWLWNAAKEAEQSSFEQEQREGVAGWRSKLLEHLDAAEDDVSKIAGLR